MTATSAAADTATSMAPPRTETLMRELRGTPLFRQLVPMEAGIGWPIPVRKGDGVPMVCLRLARFGFRPTAERGKGAVLYPPFATVTLRWDTGRPVEYVDLGYSRPWPPDPDPQPVGTFPHEAVRGSRGAYLADRRRLLACYDELFDRLARREGFDAAWVEEFGGLLRRLVEPGLEPYYRILGPSFFDRFLGPAADRAAAERPD
jgi:hypothetical protein